MGVGTHLGKHFLHSPRDKEEEEGILFHEMHQDDKTWVFEGLVVWHPLSLELLSPGAL